MVESKKPQGVSNMPEIIDLYNNARQVVGVADKSQPIPDGLNKLVTHVWIINKRGQFLLQQRAASSKMFPNMWGQTGGAAQTGEDSWQCCARETHEELGITIDFDKSVWIGTFKRPNDFVDVWVVRADFDIADLTLQADEVQDVKWATKSEIDELIDTGLFVPSALLGLQMVYSYFDLLKNYK